MKEKIVLAYSGGLDTSFCIPYLKNDKGYDVYTVFADTGGFSNNELDNLEKRALQLGASKHITINVAERYYKDCIRYMIYGNVLKNNTYPLSVSSERAFQAMAIINYAKKIGANAIAHGSTGAGNDQIRFDSMIQILAPEMKIVAPVRELKLTRKYEVDYLEKNGFNFTWNKAKYSINHGLWGTSVGGVETLTSKGELPEEAWPTPITKNGNEQIELTFKNGEPIELNGKQLTPIEIIKQLTTIADEYGIGRDVHVGDTIVGIKGRVAFQASAPLILIKAHHLLEKHVLSKWQLYWKEQLGNWYGMLLHEAQYLDPVMRDIEAFLQNSQKHVSGKVWVRLYPYHFAITGCESKYDIMSAKFAAYGEETKAFDARDVEGFTKIQSLSNRIINSISQNDNGED